MSHLRVNHYFTVSFIFGLFFKGVTDVIQTQPNVLAALGEEAHLSCQLLESKDVLQVTWLRIFADGKEMLVTYSELFGQRVNHNFADKTEFKTTGLQNCSIVIKNVTRQDEGCYQCVFHTYPEGLFIVKTCLHVYELHDPVLHVRESNSKDSLVSCSASGRPAPTVTLSVSQQDLSLSHYNTVSVSNTNGTFTVTTKAVLSGLRQNSTQVGCAVRVLSAPQKEAFVTLPEVKQTSDDGLDEKSGSNQRPSVRVPVIASFVLMVCATVLIAVLHRKHSRSSLSYSGSVERIENTPETTNRDTNEAKQTLQCNTISPLGLIKYSDDDSFHTERLSWMTHCKLHLVTLHSLAAIIQTQETVVAAVEEEAQFSCQLLQSKEVLQVTWQKVLSDREENLATYSKFYGQRVNPDFQDKVQFKFAELQNCSIVIKNVTEQDEGCYHCLFNTYPEGSLRGRTCLQIYELRDPVLHVRESNSPEESLVSCSASGRPAPTVTLSVSQQDLSLSHYNTVSVSNTNGTFTVTTKAVLSGLRQNSTQVGCAVRVLSAPQKEAFVTLPEVKQTSDDGLDEKSESNQRNLVRVPVIASCVLMVYVTVLIAFLHRKHSRSSETETQEETPETTNRDTPQEVEMNDIPENVTLNTPQNETSIVPRTVSQLKKRTPPVKNQPNDDPQFLPASGPTISS